MALAEILTLVAGVLLAQITPGPNMMAVAAASLASGRRPGLATAAGIASGVLVWATLFAFGIGAVLDAYPETLTAMRLIGGGYLLYLGLRALRAALRPSTETPGRIAGADMPSVGAAWRRGVLVVLTNPKAALMWVAVSMFLASFGLTAWQFLAVGIAASASAMLVYGAYAMLFSTGVAVRAYGRFFRLIEGAFGAIFGAIGGKLVVDGVRELRS